MIRSNHTALNNITHDYAVHKSVKRLNQSSSHIKSKEVDGGPEALRTNLLKSDFYHSLHTHLFIVDINFSAVMYEMLDTLHKSVKTNIRPGH